MRKAIWGSLSLMTASMLCIAYIPQSNSAWWSLVALVVWTISYFLLMHEGKHLAADDEMERNKNIRYIIYGGIIMRMLLLFAFPRWASDLYRILWDAKLQAIGYNPYSVTPKELMDRGLNTFSNAGNIYHQLRDVHAYTTNGPLYEWIAFLSVKLSLGKDWVMTSIFRLIIIMLDILSILTLLKWQQNAKIKLSSLLHYLFNPFIVFSIAMFAPAWTLAFALLIFSYQLMQQNRMLRSGILYVLALAASPLSLFALPILWMKASRKTIIKSSIVIALLGISAYLPYFRTADLRQNIVAEWMHDLLYYPGGGILQGFSFVNPLYPAIGLGLAILAWLFLYSRNLYRQRKEEIETIALGAFEASMTWAYFLPLAVIIAWLLEVMV